MSKIEIGDYIYVEHYHKNGTVTGDRGGHVGRYLVRFDDGDTGHVSSRDCTLIKTTRFIKGNDRLGTEQKLNMLLEYLGLEIEDDPKIIKKVENEEASN